MDVLFSNYNNLNQNTKVKFHFGLGRQMGDIHLY